jgi:hypothetical protein
VLALLQGPKVHSPIQTVKFRDLPRNVWQYGFSVSLVVPGSAPGLFFRAPAQLERYEMAPKAPLKEC